MGCIFTIQVPPFQHCAQIAIKYIEALNSAMKFGKNVIMHISLCIVVVACINNERSMGVGKEALNFAKMIGHAR